MPALDWRVALVDTSGNAISSLSTDTELPAAVALDDNNGNSLPATTPLVGGITHIYDASVSKVKMVRSANNLSDGATGGTLLPVALAVHNGATFDKLQADANKSLRTVAAGYTTMVDATLTRPANTTAYAAGDEIADTGGSVITLSNMARFSGGSGIIQSVLIAVSSNWATKPSMELWLYDTTNAPATDNSAFDPTDGENDTLVAVIPVSSTYVGDATASTGNFTMTSGVVGIPFKCNGSANLFMRIVIRNAGQAGANSDTLKFRFKVLQD